ncbi:hypothetical protein N8079_00650 [Crocinitomicaceae bacterium]|nr:hypothetical protein [Crocinitomicaceae bacterium]
MLAFFTRKSSLQIFLPFVFIDWITFLDGIGIFVFAISVVLTAIGKGFDVVGATILLLVLQRRWVEEHCAI